jgi:HSP20 family protein
MDLHREMNRLFDDVWRGIGPMVPGPSASTSLIAAPRVDIQESERGLEVTAELPGVAQADVEVRVDDDVLTIRGEKREEKKDARAHLTERFFGTFERAIQLPYSPDPDQVQAQFEDGVLRVMLPKEGRVERSHRIEIRGGKSDQAIEGTRPQPGNGGSRPAASQGGEAAGQAGGT